MTTFDDRERAFENLFAHDQDLAFRAQARRTRDIGLWAAHQLGRAGADADVYASEILTLAVSEGAGEPVIGRIRRDLEAHGISVPDDQLRRRMDELLAQAVADLRTS